MSIIYSTLTSAINKISDEFHKSFLFTTIFSILEFVETQWVNSFFKKLYPDENFLSFLNKNQILKNHIFHPLVVLFLFAMFLLLSINNPSTSLVITLLIGFVAFFIGSAILPKYFFNKSNQNILQFEKRDIYSIGFCLILVSIVFFFISIASVGGVPLLKSSLRYSLNPIFTMPVFLVIPGIGLIASHYLSQYKKNKISRSQARFRFLVLTTIGIATVLALEYRTPIIAILLMMIIIGYYGKILSVWEVLLGALFGVVAITGIGYIRSLNELAISSSTDPFSTLESRANFTMHVLNLLNQISGNFGLLHGKMLASAMPGSELGPRMLVGKLIAWRTEVTVTPTLLGQMLVDFGKVGVAVEMCLLGFLLGTGYKIVKITQDSFYIVIYSLILTYSIVGVETGILDIQVLFYFFIIAVIYFAAILKDRGIKIY